MSMAELLATKDNQSSKEGVSRLYFRIADITVALTSADPTLKLRIDASVEKFVTAGRDPDVFIWAAFPSLGEDSL
jgi:hypothetical protein